MKKQFKGYLYNRLEELGNETFNHIGCESDGDDFGDFMQSFVPKLGMKKKVIITVEIIDENEMS
jgi:hypothetical protein